ncbi:hypothetical protein OAO01_01235 [Oligoflexia bacterium]|nr:hypothetical protein [Oligoflexia bacterium]
MKMKAKPKKPKAKRELAQLTFTVDSFANGIAFGQHRLPQGEDPRDYYNLRVRDDSEVVRLRSRYILHKNNPLHELERHLMRLSQQGVLRASTIYLGTTTDPFFPFEGKFDASMKFLDLFQRYTPGMLCIQTRSPLIVIALPVFKKLGKHCSVTLGLETCLEESVQRYTPGLPRIAERLKTATALKRFGIEVNLQVNPVLPYGDWRRDAGEFAEILVEHGDHVFIKSITDGSEQEERKIRATTLARKLAGDRKFHWLRPDTANPLIAAVEKLAPEKLKLPTREHTKSKQIDMFAA